jgi:L-ribulose-5-phosphate 3-epimerase
MQLGGHDIGVCSWSLRPATPADLVAGLDELGLDHVQIALAPLLDASPDERAAVVGTLVDAGVVMTAGMIGFADESYATIAAIRKTGGFVSNALWPARRDRAVASAALAKDLGLPLVTAHAGFIPPSGDPDYAQVVARLSELAAAFAAQGVELALETGQESAAELLQFLNDLNQPNVGVNFDAANMVMYGSGDPGEAVNTLGRHIHHVHIKDAVASPQPGIDWGTEVPFGTGQIEVHTLLRALRDAAYSGPLVIERETGNQRKQDVAHAIEVLAAHYGG